MFSNLVLIYKITKIMPISQTCQNGLKTKNSTDFNQWNYFFNNKVIYPSNGGGVEIPVFGLGP